MSPRTIVKFLSILVSFKMIIQQNLIFAKKFNERIDHKNDPINPPLPTIKKSSFFASNSFYQSSKTTPPTSRNKTSPEQEQFRIDMTNFLLNQNPPTLNFDESIREIEQLINEYARKNFNEASHKKAALAHSVLFFDEQTQQYLKKEFGITFDVNSLALFNEIDTPNTLPLNTQEIICRFWQWYKTSIMNEESLKYTIVKALEKCCELIEYEDYANQSFVEMIHSDAPPIKKEKRSSKKNEVYSIKPIDQKIDELYKIIKILPNKHLNRKN